MSCLILDPNSHRDLLEGCTPTAEGTSLLKVATAVFNLRQSDLPAFCRRFRQFFPCLVQLKRAALITDLSTQWRGRDIYRVGLCRRYIHRIKRCAGPRRLGYWQTEAYIAALHRVMPFGHLHVFHQVRLCLRTPRFAHLVRIDRVCNRCQDSDHRHHHHEFDQGETSCCSLHRCVLLALSRNHLHRPCIRRDDGRRGAEYRTPVR